MSVMAIVFRQIRHWNVAHAEEEVNLTACPSAEQQARCDALAVEQRRKSFDLERGSLMRWALVRRLGYASDPTRAR